MLKTFYDSASYNVDLVRGRPAGLPHRPLRGLAAPAGRHRSGALLEHVADVRQPDAGRVVGRRAVEASARPGTSVSPSSAGSRSCWPCSCSGGDGAPTSASRPVRSGTSQSEGAGRPRPPPRLSGSDSVSARFVLGKLAASLATLVFVVVFNFFLFRVVAGDPVATLFRGRNLTDGQREELRQQFGLDGSKLDQFWALPAADGAAQLRALVHLERARDGRDREPCLADDPARRRRRRPLGGHRRAARASSPPGTGGGSPTMRPRRSR